MLKIEEHLNYYRNSEVKAVSFDEYMERVVTQRWSQWAAVTVKSGRSEKEGLTGLSLMYSHLNTNVPYRVIEDRVLRKGWKLSDAIKAGCGDIKEYRREYNDFFKKNNTLGLTYQVFYKRVVVMGWSLEKAVRTPKRSEGKPKQLSIERSRKNSWKHRDFFYANNTLGLPYITFYVRVERHGWSLERAISTPSKSRPRLFSR